MPNKQELIDANRIQYKSIRSFWSNSMDRLSALLSHFSITAGLFHSGEYCGVGDIGTSGTDGHLHFLRSGRLHVNFRDGTQQTFSEPTLLFFPRALPHRFSASKPDDAQMLCASLAFDGNDLNPVVRALPDAYCVALTDLPSIEPCLQLLFDEAFEAQCGRIAVINRLFEVIVIQLLRHMMNHNVMSTGMLAGLAEPRFAKVLTHIHHHPQVQHTLESLANLAGMSRARFAEQFHATVGVTVGEYILAWRVALTQKQLRQGHSLKRIAPQMGYETPSALARAFRRKTGFSPSEWMDQQSMSSAHH